MDIFFNGLASGGIETLIYTLECIIIFCTVVFIINLANSIFRTRANHNFFKNNVVTYNSSVGINSPRVYRDVPASKLAQFNISDINTLKDFLYGQFEKFEYAINDLDYEEMALIATKQLYHNYYTGINLDIKAGQKRIIRDITKKRVVLYNLESTINSQIASVMIEISYINYMINKAGYIMKGSKADKITERFEVVFKKEYHESGVTKCPNCGASITGHTCEYCRTQLQDEEFQISSIKRVMSENEWAEKYK